MDANQTKIDRVKTEYMLDKKLVDKIQAMSMYTKKDANHLVETALKFFISTHNDYLGIVPQDSQDLI